MCSVKCRVVRRGCEGNIHSFLYAPISLRANTTNPKSKVKVRVEVEIKRKGTTGWADRIRWGYPGRNRDVA